MTTRAILLLVFVCLAPVSASAATIAYFTGSLDSPITGATSVYAGVPVTLTPTEPGVGYDFYGSRNYTFSILEGGTPNALGLGIDNLSREADVRQQRYWSIRIGSGGKEGQLAPGLYTDVFGLQDDPYSPNLDVTANGTGARTYPTLSYFVVYEIAFDDMGNLTKLAFDFLQYADVIIDGNRPYTWGSIRINSERPIAQAPVFDPLAVPLPASWLLISVGIAAISLASKQRIASSGQPMERRLREGGANAR